MFPFQKDETTLTLRNTVFIYSTMLFTLTMLRHLGKRKSCPLATLIDAKIESKSTAGFLCLIVKSQFSGHTNPVGKLYEPKIIRFDFDQIHFLGFEIVDGTSYVQEWILQPPAKIWPRNERNSRPAPNPLY